jgi:RNA polymerase sigma factor (sigma-70 family)
MNVIPWRQPLSATSPVSSPGDVYARLIVDNLSHIENQCRRTVVTYADAQGANYGGAFSYDRAAIGNDTDELLNEVLNHLKADDFRVLRQFQGKSKLSTYLTTIIANLVVDLVRKKKGRCRAKERSRELGEVAERLYGAVYGHGFSLDEAHSFLQGTWGITESHAELGVLLEQIRGRESLHLMHAGDCWPFTGQSMLTEDGEEISIADRAPSAEVMLAGEQTARLARRVLSAVLEELTGEERIILSLRFPIVDGDEPKGNGEIATMLGLTEKAVDNRVRRILNRCRQMILSKGLCLSDLIGAGI